MKTHSTKTDKDSLGLGDRFGGLVTVPVMLFVFAFFAYHQWTNTGYFTAKFGSWEMLALYGPILFSLAAPIARAVSGRRNPGRPFEAATNFFLAAGSLWLFIVFPFDFAHLSDILPGALRFFISWINNDVGRFVLLLQVMVGFISAFWNTFKYVSVRTQASAA